MTDTAPLQPGRGRALRGLGVPRQDIERLSMERLRAQIATGLPPPPADTVVLRMAYASGDPALVRDVVIDENAVRGAVESIRSRQFIVCDTRMVLVGIRSAAEAAGVPVISPLDYDGFTQMRPGWFSRETEAAVGNSIATSPTTVTALKMVSYLTQSGGGTSRYIVVIGNAPSALLAVLDMLGDGMPPPAALIATCPGMVAAAEAKQLLLDSRAALNVPVIAVRGTRGGSPVAAAAVNALCRLAAAH